MLGLSRLWILLAIEPATRSVYRPTLESEAPGRSVQDVDAQFNSTDHEQLDGLLSIAAVSEHLPVKEGEGSWSGIEFQTQRRANWAGMHIRVVRSLAMCGDRRPSGLRIQRF